MASLVVQVRIGKAPKEENVMGSIETAPKDGRYVLAFFGSPFGAFVYFENGKWLAPQMVGRPELGVNPVNPVSWVDIPTPPR
jgi:hypothetical protein